MMRDANAVSGSRFKRRSGLYQPQQRRGRLHSRPQVHRDQFARHGRWRSAGLLAQRFDQLGCAGQELLQPQILRFELANALLEFAGSRLDAFERLAPPWQAVRVLEKSGGLEDGARLRGGG